MEQIEHTQAQLESLNDAMRMDQEISFAKEQADGDVKRITEYYENLCTNPVELAIEEGRCCVKDNKDGSYSASFVTEQVGEAKLSVTIEEEHIKGSPYSVMVGQDYKSIDKPIKIINGDGKLKRVVHGVLHG